MITKDGDIIYENYDDAKARELESACKEIQSYFDMLAKINFDTMVAEKITLTNGVYYKMCESIDVLMLCRSIGIFGYEFVTVGKVPTEYNRRKYYREQRFYEIQEAQHSFALRSGFAIHQPTPTFADDDLRVILSCLNQNIYLNNNITKNEKAEVEAIISKVEQMLPQQTDILPRYFFDREQEG